MLLIAGTPDSITYAAGIIAALVVIVVGLSLLAIGLVLLSWLTVVAYKTMRWARRILSGRPPAKRPTPHPYGSPEL